jgi:predicted metal-binding membrane protein
MQTTHRDVPVVALTVGALAWTAISVAAMVGGRSGQFAAWMSVGRTAGSMLGFLGGWEIMVVAMMLPSSIGFLVLFRVATTGSRFRSVRRVSVCVGYSLAWVWMGCVALLVGATLYRTGPIDLWLKGHSNVLAGGVLTLAGGFQLTTLKRRCLTICSHPATFLMRYYRRGIGHALALGLRYGLACLGCCWALMTLMVVLGGGSLFLMMLLTVIMFAERAMGWNDRFVKIVGVTGVVLGVFIAASPDAVPALAHNAGSWIEMNSTMPTSDHGWLFWCHA